MSNAQADEPQSEKRRHRRIKTRLLGRYMLEDGREFPCIVVDISDSGIALVGPVLAPIGSPVVVYIDKLGRVQGQVAGPIPIRGGFAVSLLTTTRAAQKFAERLAGLDPHSLLRSLPEHRLEPRIGLENAKAMLEPAGVVCEILDLSLSSARIKIDRPLEVGSRVRLGPWPGTVVRQTGDGAAIEFDDIWAATTLTERLAEVALPEPDSDTSGDQPALTKTSGHIHR
jgi:hypothetical protein